ncbi:MAG: hypothetical protein FJ387_26860 [Verrucomicrobia bacterium]|nr:hypothetical protein [Verrucomicrobiota bacterium]
MNVSSVPSLTVWLAIAANTGAAFTSLTVTVKDLLSDRTPSLTRTVIVLVLGPCASVGVQENAPPAVIDAPAGAPGSRLKLSV